MCGGGRETLRKSLAPSELHLPMAPSVTIPSEATKASGDQEDDQPVPASPDRGPTLYIDSPPKESVKRADTGASISTEEDDLQKAIAMSIQDQQQLSKPGGESLNEDSLMLSAEDREVSRALEESLRSFPSSGATIRCSNPNDRKRSGVTPVGLVNLGNSCWFNVVAQTLFHLPGFRDMFISFNYPVNTTSKKVEFSDTKESESNACPKLAEELTRLFALMLCSEQKYISPNECFSLSRKLNDRYLNEQQDVCEYFHKLLERLETFFNDVLKEEGEEKESSGTSKDAGFKNPIMRLFYGQFSTQTTTVSCEDNDSKPENLFGQYPLTVLQCGDIHDSILASMSGQHNEKNLEKEPSLSGTGAIPKVSEDFGVKQEQWFKMLPPVLIFSLSRYEYSQSKQITEKVHNKFEFPEVLYMDRYMETNKAIVLEKHMQVAAIKKQLQKLKSTLARYQNFGSDDDSKHPLREVLTCMNQFIKTSGLQCSEAPTNQMDVVSSARETIPELSSRMDVDSSDEMDCNDSLTISYAPPRCVLTQLEFELMSQCLSRWQESVGRTEEELKGHISQLELQLQQMYSEDELKRMGYKLYAVVVHEGQANAGHYWVYIVDDSGEWYKYNDVQVTRSSWQEVEHDSIGGSNNASAYCLLYTDINRVDVLFPTPLAPVDDIQEILQSLPLHLQEHVKQDNVAFHDEIKKFDSNNSQHPGKGNLKFKAVIHPAPTAPNSPEKLSCISDDKNVNAKFYQKINTLTSKLAYNHLNNYVLEYIKLEKNIDIAKVEEMLTEKLYKFFDDTIERVGNMTLRVHSNMMSPLLDFNAFLLANKAQCCKEILYLHCFLIMKQHSSNAPETSDITEMVSVICSKQIVKLQTSEIIETYKDLNRLYQEILHTVWHLISGVKAFECRKFETALPLLLRAHHMYLQAVFTRGQLPAFKANDIAEESFKDMFREDILVFWRNKCLSSLSHKLIEYFKSCTVKEKAKETLHIMRDILCPVLSELSNNGKTEDIDTSANIRHYWVRELFENPLPDHCDQEVVTQILQAILSDDENATSQVVNLPASVEPFPSVQEMHEQLKQIISKYPPNTTSL